MTDLAYKLAHDAAAVLLALVIVVVSIRLGLFLIFDLVAGWREFRAKLGASSRPAPRDDNDPPGSFHR